jgi:hypothetical protein
MAEIKVDWSQRVTATARDAEDARLRALRYLAETDWLVLRAADGGKPVPEDIRKAREEARRTASGGLK